MSENPVLPFSPPNFGAEEVAAVSAVVASGWVGTGPKVADFENRFADYLGGIGECSAVASCTSGLFLGMLSLGLGPGDEVITTAMTFVSTINSIIHTGATPVVVDIDQRSKNISPAKITEAITSRTRAILVVHYAGYPCDMTEISKLAEDNGLLVIEDCAHAIETLHGGVHAGQFSDFAAFSFYATKNIAIGEGGIVYSRDKELVERVARLSLHGLSRGAWQRFSASGKRSYDVVDIGYKANMTDLQAAIGLEQLEKIESMYWRRQEIWDFYNESLKDLPLELPNLPSNSGDKHALHLFAVGLNIEVERDSFVQHLSDSSGVVFGIHYKSITDFEIYGRFAKFPPETTPIADSWGRRCVSLSLSAGMTDSHVEQVVGALRDALS